MPWLKTLEYMNLRVRSITVAPVHEDATRRMKADQFKAAPDEAAGPHGCPDSGQPQNVSCRTGRQAALLVTQEAVARRAVSRSWRVTTLDSGSDLSAALLWQMLHRNC